VLYRLYDIRHRTTADIPAEKIETTLRAWYPHAFEEGREWFRELQTKTIRGEDTRRVQADLMVSLVPLT